MTTPLYTIRVRVGHQLMERIEAMSGYLGVSLPDFIQYAIEKELRHQTLHQVREDIALEEIQRNILAKGQTISVQLEGENEELAVCQLCLTSFPRRPEAQVEGPVLCDACYALARGADFTGLEPPDL